MNISTSFVPKKSFERKEGETRYQFTIVVAAEAHELPLFSKTLFIQTTACPVKIFQFADSRVKTGATGRSIINAINQKHTYAVFARNSMPVNSWLAGCGLSIVYPGTTDFGWIDQDDYERLQAWLAPELEKIADRLHKIVVEGLSKLDAADPTNLSISRNTSPTSNPVTSFVRPKVVQPCKRLLIV